jgi:uncharacterized membrane protein YfcA
MTILLYLAIGLAVGVVSGSVGIGGGVLMLPALIWLCGFKADMAAGTTLAVLVVPVVLPAALEYYTRDKIDIHAALFIAVAFAVGGYAGAFLRHEHYLPEELLRLCLGLIMMYIAFNLIVMSDSQAAKAMAGLVGTVAAWLAFLGLRSLGRRTLSRPHLKAEIRRMDQTGHGDPDYYI